MKITSSIKYYFTKFMQLLFLNRSNIIYFNMKTNFELFHRFITFSSSTHEINLKQISIE